MLSRIAVAPTGALLVTLALMVFMSNLINRDFVSIDPIVTSPINLEPFAPEEIPPTVIGDEIAPSPPIRKTLPSAEIVENDTGSLIVEHSITEVIGTSSLDSDPVKIVNAPAMYPPRAATKGIEGFVELGFAINKHGAPIDIVVLNTEPLDQYGRLFETAAINALQKTRYQPAFSGGKASATSNQRIRIVFALDK